MKTWQKVVLAIGAWEGFWWVRRRTVRQRMYDFALAEARRLGKPLVIVGAPDIGPTQGPGCGDITVDIAKSACPNSIQADITKKIPLADDSAVVLVICTLEFVTDPAAALKELRRVAGPHLYNVKVEPWTLTANFFPTYR